jgi:hypothetical protein
MKISSYLPKGPAPENRPVGKEPTFWTYQSGVSGKYGTIKLPVVRNWWCFNGYHSRQAFSSRLHESFIVHGKLASLANTELFEYYPKHLFHIACHLSPTRDSAQTLSSTSQLLGCCNDVHIAICLL